MVERIDQLPEKYRMCVILHYYQELNYAEIEKILDLSRNQVDNNLCMARKILRLELENDAEKENKVWGALPMVAAGPALTDIFIQTADIAVTPAVQSACLQGGGVYTAFSTVGKSALGMSEKTARILKTIAVATTVTVGD